MSEIINNSPVNGKTPELKADMPIKHAAFVAFNYFYRNMIWNEKGTHLDKDPEFLHYFRVSSKRLRVALSVFRPHFRKVQVKSFKEEIKKLAPVLGKPRDLDVYLEFLKEEFMPEISASQRKSMDGYLGFFRNSRQDMQESIDERIASRSYRTFKARFELFLDKGLSGRAKSGSSGIANFARQVIRREGKTLLKSAKRLLRHSSNRRLHCFRIECRKMRYRTELFLALLGDDGRKLSRKLVELQNALGGWHDSVTADEKLEHFLETNPDFRQRPAIRKLRKFQKHRANRHKKKFFRKLDGIRKIRKLI